jgi:hypothetical protein
MYTLDPTSVLVVTRIVSTNSISVPQLLDYVAIQRP